MPLTTYVVQPTDSTLPSFEVEANRAERDDSGYLNFYEGNELIGSYVNVNFRKKPTSPETE